MYENCNFAIGKAWGTTQRKLVVHSSIPMLFLLFYSPKPRSQVTSFICRKWSIFNSRKGPAIKGNTYLKGVIFV